MDMLEKLAQYSLVAVINTPVANDAAEELAKALTNGGVRAAEVDAQLENASVILACLSANGICTGIRLSQIAESDASSLGVAEWISCGNKELVHAGSAPCVVRDNAAFSETDHVRQLLKDEVHPLISVTAENADVVFTACERDAGAIFCLNVFAEDIRACNWAGVTTACKAYAKKMLGMYLHHIGINSPDMPACLETVADISSMLALAKSKETPTAVFVDSWFEVMKKKGPGTHGHICVRVSCIERAINYYKSIGVRINEDSRQYNAEGKLFVIYFEKEIGGFIYHLIEV